MSKIFIQIASYRDPDLNNTIYDLINNAAYPSRLFFGICDQYDNINKIDDKLKQYINISILSIPYDESRGTCWARSLTQSLFNGEDFTLQIDSHTRSEPNWDEKIIDLYSSFNSKNIILSTYPSMFTPGQNYNEYNKEIYSCHVYGMKNGLINARPRKLVDKTKPMRATSLAAGFIFGSGDIIILYI